MWLGTLAWQRQNRNLWILAGALYGLGFYTYLAMRFTPVLLVAIALVRLFQQGVKRSNPLKEGSGFLALEFIRGAGWFMVGAVVIVFPLGMLAWKMPAFILSRTTQVSILNPDINGGNLIGTLLTQTGRALGMFFWQGDTILRHNPAGRPVFDPLMTIPFLIGIGWGVRHWRKPAVGVLFLWVGTMLGVTILAEDTPHFLRAVGILPAILFFPALGLYQIWGWQKMPAFLRQTIVVLIIAGSFLWGATDYWQYGQQPDTAYLFEATNRELATQINQDALAHAVIVQQRLWEDRPALDFFVQPSDNLGRFDNGGEFPAGLIPPVTVYMWATDSPANIWAGLKMPAHIITSQSSLVRGDLEPEPYPLYMRFDVQPLPPSNVLARFGDHIQLQSAVATFPDAHTLQIDLDWHTTLPLAEDYVVFVHVIDETGLVAQSDRMPAFNTMPTTQWQTHWLVHDSHTISLPQPFDKNSHRVYIGLYLPENVTRLPAFSPENAPIGDNWQLPFTNKN
jgi:hypothetical protein